MVLEAYTSILASLATVFGSLMSLAYLPQIYKIYKRKSVADISITMYLVFFFGILIWLSYGLSTSNMPLIIANGIGTTTASTIIIQYMIYKK